MPEMRFDDEWRRWIAENLILGGSRESILAALVKSGFLPETASAEIERAAGSPYLLGSRRLANRLKKREWILEIHRRLNRALPTGETVEVRDKLPREVFLRDFYTTNRPVVIKGAMDDWPAMRKWSPAYFKERFGDRVVEVQMRRNASQRYEIESNQHRQQISLGEYVDLISAGGATNDYYMTANNFMAQVFGRKLVKLIPSCDLPHLYNDQHCYSPVDAEAIDFDRFPGFHNARVIDCEIGPGDLLFLPIGWWHYMKSLDVSMTVSFTNFQFDNDFHAIYSTYHDV